MWGGKLLRILFAENVELYGMAWYTVYIAENDKLKFIENVSKEFSNEK